MEPNSLSPKNFFLQVGIIVTLYASTVAFLSYIFDLINIAFPDLTYNDFYGGGYSGSMRIALSVLIVFFPIFIWILSVYRKNISTLSPKENKLRKWFIYLTLFLTAIAIATDLVVLINTFLSGGDITLRFILKCFAVAIVCGTIFYSSLKDLKDYWGQNVTKAKAYSWTVIAVVVVAVVGGLFYVGSPANQRKLNEDSQRVQNLSEIQGQVVNFYQQKGRLPESLEEVKDPLSYFVLPVDPKTGDQYEYVNKGNLSFELCAIFELANVSRGQASKPIYPYMTENENWQHGAGRVCFARTIDPERYPLIKK